MTTTEDRLRDAFRADAGNIRPDTVRTLGTVREPGSRLTARGADRVQAGRIRRVALPAGAAAAVTVIVVLAAVLVPQALGTRQHGSAATTTAGGAAASSTASGFPAPPYPTYFVAAIVSTQMSGQGSSLEVRSATTGDLVTKVRPPRGLSFESVSTGNGQTFIAAAGKSGVCRTWLYQFQLSPAGRPGPLTPFAGGSVRAGILSAVTLSANDQVMAYAASPCTDAKHFSAFVRVTNLGSGHATQWTFPSQEDVGSISLSADGTRLAYNVALTKLFPSIAAVVPTSAPAGTLAERSHVVETGQKLAPSTTIASAVLSPDGRTLYTLTHLTGPALAHHLSTLLNATDVGSGAGQPSRVLPGLGFNVWASPGGGWLLVQSGLGSSFSTPRLGRVDENGDEIHQLRAGWLKSGQAAGIAW